MSKLFKSIKSCIQMILNKPDALFWCSFWFGSNLMITFYNKHVLSSLNISPIINTSIHMFFTFFGCCIKEKFKFPELTKQELFRMILFSFIFSLNIAMSQLGMKLTTLSLNQIARAATPFFQVIFELIIVKRNHTFYSILPLIPVCLGIAITSVGEINLTFIAFIISGLSVIISALKGVLSMMILQNLKSKLQEYSFLIIVTPLSFLWLMFFQCISLILNNPNKITHIISINDVRTLIDINNIASNSIYIYLIIGGLMAFMVNVASFGTVKRTSASAMGVMANAKQAITIFGAMLLTEGIYTNTKLFGAFITIFGAAWYSYNKNKPKGLLPK